MNVTGANKIELLKKGKKQLLLIGDYHYHYKKDGCSFFSFKKSLLVPEFIEKVIKSNPVKTWDFYFEQGVVTEEGVPSYKFLNKIKESPTNEIIKEAQREYKKYVSMWNKSEISLLNLTHIYFSMIGCIPRTKQCPENLRLHFIDIRQKYFGKCNIGLVHNHINFYDNLTDALELDRLDEFIDKIIDTYQELLTNCSPTQTKINKQIFKSEIPDKVMIFFETKISGIIDLISDVSKILENGKSEIIKLFKEDLVNETIKAGEYILTECKKIDAFNRLENISGGFKSSKKIDFLWQVMFVYIVTLMDMYALGRMTKPSNKNMIVLAGMNHVERYRNFFIKQGWVPEWEANQPYKKCSEVPMSIFDRGVKGKSKKKRTKKKK